LPLGQATEKSQATQETKQDTEQASRTRKSTQTNASIGADMDTGNGKFEIIEPTNAAEMQKAMREMMQKHPNHGGWFQEGEEIEIKGSRFRVKSVKPTEIRLKLLPKE